MNALIFPATSPLRHSKNNNGSPRLVVCLSDTHVGSSLGLLQPDFITHEGNRIGQNDLQKWIWQAWQDCRKWRKGIIGNDKYALVINGDVIEGNHHHTKEIWSPDDGDHLTAAVELFSEFKDASAIYITEGTEAHTKNLEHAFAKMLKHKGLKVVSPSTKRGAWDSLKLRVAGAQCEFDHHMSTVMRSYLEASALSITLGDIRNQRSRAGNIIPRVVMRSHRHRFGLYEDGYGMMIALPAWQGLTRYGRKYVPGATPQLGMLILDWRNSEDDDTPVVHKRLHTIRNTPPIAL